VAVAEETVAGEAVAEGAVAGEETDVAAAGATGMFDEFWT
jgi:hypothetical protein